MPPVDCYHEHIDNHETGGFTMNTPAKVRPLFIRRNQLKEITGLSPSTIWRLEKDGLFPKRRQIGSCVGWIFSEVELFLKNSEAV